MRWVWVVLMGCGRVGFDPTSGGSATGDGGGSGTLDANVINNGDAGAQLGHDEDGDGLNDVIDPCPHLAGDTADADSDGVGDACDSRPGTLDHIRLFDAMTTIDASLQLQGAWNLTDDALSLNSTGFAMVNRTFAIVDADIWIGLTVESLATSDNQIIIHASTGTEQPRYYGQLYKTGTVREQAIIGYDDVSFTDVDKTPLTAAGIPIADLTLQFRVVVGGDATWVTTWPGESYQTRGAIPGYAGSPRVRFAMNGMTGAIRYMCVIAPR